MHVDKLDIFLPYLEWLAGVSLVTFFLSVLLIPMYIGRLPQNYFIHLQKKNSQFHYSPLSLLILFTRNIVGIVLVFAGIIMLFLPGQGLLTILIGILCMSFPGKHRFIVYLTTRSSTQRSLNWTRKRLSRPPFLWQ